MAVRGRRGSPEGSLKCKCIRRYVCTHLECTSAAGQQANSYFCTSRKKNEERGCVLALGILAGVYSHWGPGQGAVRTGLNTDGLYHHRLDYHLPRWRNRTRLKSLLSEVCACFRLSTGRYLGLVSWVFAHVLLSSLLVWQPCGPSLLLMTSGPVLAINIKYDEHP